PENAMAHLRRPPSLYIRRPVTARRRTNRTSPANRPSAKSSGSGRRRGSRPNKPSGRRSRRGRSTSHRPTGDHASDSPADRIAAPDRDWVVEAMVDNASLARPLHHQIPERRSWKGSSESHSQRLAPLLRDVEPPSTE